MYYILFMILLASCGAQTGVKKESIVIAIASTPATIDLHKSTDVMSRSVFVHVFDSPLAIDTNGNLIPALASSWKFTNPTNIQLTVRKGVQFHNGRDVTAGDIAASLKRLTVVPEAQTLYSKIKDVSTEGDNIVNISLKSPFPSMLGYLAHPKAAIYPKEEIDKYGTNTIENPVGTGPYRYVDYIHGDRVVLKANPQYWDGAPGIENLEFKVIIDELVRSISLETGDIQGVMDTAASQVNFLKDNPDIIVYPFNSVSIDYLGLNTRSPRLQNKRLREAIALAIDKKAIIDSVHFGFANSVDSLFDDRIFGAYTDADPLTYNPEASRAIIREEGLLGYKLNILANEGIRARTAEVIQGFLKEIGIDVEIHILEWATYLDTLKRGDHELFLLGWSNSAFDPDSSLRTVFHTDNIASGYNSLFYSNPVVDRLIEEASVEIDEKKRKQQYIEAQKTIREDRSVVFLSSKIFNLAFHKDVEGLQLIPSGDHRLHKLRYKD